MSNLIRLFIASPGDVAEERKRLAKIVDGLNGQLAEHMGVRFELKEWRHVTPGMGRPEDVILDQLPVTTWDVFIGLLWLRFGMPPGKNRGGEDHDSGTEEEFHLAHRANMETGRPRILFYRCTRQAPVSVDIEQLGRVQRFFVEFGPNGQNPGLFQDFGRANEFEKMVEKHLTKLLIEEYQTNALPPKMRPDIGNAGYPSKSPSELSDRTTGPSTLSGGWRNPFTVGVPIMNPADFFGRDREVSYCLARLSGMQSVSITGERRIGKSSLLHYLTATARERLGPEYRPAYVDLLSPAARTLPGLLGEILRKLSVKHTAVSLIEFEQRLNELNSQGIKPLVALDELEMFVRLPSEFSHDFCEAFRSMASNRRLVLLTASQTTLSEMQKQGALVSPLNNIMGTRKLEMFTEEDARKFVSLQRGSVGFSAEQTQEILQRGGGHPLRLQSLCFNVAQAICEHRSDWTAIWAEAEEEAAAMLGIT